MFARWQFGNLAPQHSEGARPERTLIANIERLELTSTHVQHHGRSRVGELALVRRFRDGVR